jgi:uncharacterized protein (DUF1684 family)
LILLEILLKEGNMRKRINMSTRMLSMVIIVGLVAILAGGCGEAPKTQNGDPYEKEIQTFHKERLTRLKAKDGWLSLVGLFWLEEGDNSFGGSDEADFVLEIKNVPPLIGTFVYQEDQVRFKAAEGISVSVGGKAVEELALNADDTGKATILSHGSLSWFIIKRGDKMGVRVRDSKSPRIAQLTHIDAFPAHKKWRVEARFEKYDSPRPIKTPTVLGTIEEQPSPGVLVFNVKGKDFKLHPIGGSGNLFIVFGDESNTVETYGGGRFLTVKKPDADGKAIIDFNKAVNPPCMFSPYATCPMPPKENILPFPVYAGEKMVKGLGH